MFAFFWVDGVNMSLEIALCVWYVRQTDKLGLAESLSG